MCEFEIRSLWVPPLVGAAVFLVWSLGSRLFPSKRQHRIGLEERFVTRARERERIARELHDSLFQGIQGLMFRLQAVRQLLPERPEEAIAMLEAALETGDRAMHEGRMAVRDLREPALGRGGLAETLVALGEEFTPSGHKPNYQVLIAGGPLILALAIHDDVYCVVREAIRNAFRHAQSSRIEVKVTFEKARFSIRISDDGVGIDEQILAQGRREGHWGLPGMRERAVSLGGKLEVWSEYGSGTKVELRVPGDIAYRRPKLRFWFTKQYLTH
jgi:signal transduction histidine kinase